jgi:hypothetical protein
MAKTASIYNYSNSELGVLLLKDADIHEGLWLITVNFVMSSGNFTPSVDQPESTLPATLIGVQGFGLVRAEGPGPTVLDAEKLNPR